MLTQLKLQIFSSLAKTLNFSKTANELFVSQQTVSRLISELEDELGVQLFYRSTRSVQITPAGQRYYKAVLDMFWIHHMVVSELRNMNQATDGFTIDMQSHLSTSGEPQTAMEKLREEYPDVSVPLLRIPPNQLISRLKSYKSDLVIMLDRFFTDDKSLQYTSLVDSEYLLMANPSLLKHDEFRTLPLLFDFLDNESPEDCFSRCHREIELLDIAPNNVIWFPNAETAYSRAALGEGMLISSSLDKVGQSYSLDVFHTGVPCRVLAVWRANENNPLIKKYVDLMASCYKQRTSKCTQC